MTKKLWSIVDYIVSLMLPTKIQTFTYYIPAPPPRKTGYREKQFDKLTYLFLNRGFKIIEQQLVPQHSTPGGFWIIFTLQSISLRTRNIDLSDEDGNELINTIQDLVPENELPDFQLRPSKEI